MWTEWDGVLPLAGTRTVMGKGTRMRHSSTRIALAITGAIIISPAWAQIPQLAAVPPQWTPPATNPGATFEPSRIQAPTPEDAYRDGTINRWEYERLVGPLPTALQGPSVNGSRGGDGGSFDGGK